MVFSSQEVLNDVHSVIMASVVATSWSAILVISSHFVFMVASLLLAMLSIMVCCLAAKSFACWVVVIRSFDHAVAFSPSAAQSLPNWLMSAIVFSSILLVQEVRLTTPAVRMVNKTFDFIFFEFY